jgi:tight adherence protein B
MFDLDIGSLSWLLAGLAVAAFVEGAYLIFHARGSYRKNVNRRLRVMDDQANREAVLVELRRERGLTESGDYRLPLVKLNRLILQSGVTVGLGRLAIISVALALFGLVAGLLYTGDAIQATATMIFCGIGLPLLSLLYLRSRRLKKFSSQFPDALDVIVRSLRAGHPVPVAIATVGREMPDPIGSEFGLISDEITYGADLETAMRNLYYRVGTDDLPLFVTAVAIQTSTGGNLGEILQNLSGVIRQRFKMRRKIRALASEGRASAIVLSLLPLGVFAAIHFVAPGFYDGVWNESLTKICLTAAGCWMGLGNFVMFRMVNFKI